MIDPGRRSERITFQRAAVTTDDHGGEVETWADHVTAWAEVRWGTGQERREAAQERGQISATFVCDWTPTLAAVTERDRILYQGAVWDLSPPAFMARQEIHFTGVKNQ